MPADEAQRRLGLTYIFLPKISGAISGDALGTAGSRLSARSAIARRSGGGSTPAAISGILSAMPMTLGGKQRLFARLVARLIDEATARGFDVTLGEAYRSPEEAARLAAAGKGIAHSLHTDRLAIDLNLFRDGTYLTDTASYEPLGVWWETRSTDDLTCCWGGRFKDGNHFSIAHGGRK